jgi:rhamnogalacturonan endolyase
MFQNQPLRAPKSKIAPLPVNRPFAEIRFRMHKWRDELLRWLISLNIAVFFIPCIASANIPGGGTGSGPAVTVTDNGDGTVTLANGIASILIVKKTGRLNALFYTHNNGAGPVTSEILLSRGNYYYGGFSLGTGVFDYSLARDPASNGGSYGDVMLLSNSDNNGAMEIHFSMLRGSPGFYSTAVMTHRAQDAKSEVGAWGVVTRVTAGFNWLSADAMRNFLIGIPSSKGVKVPNSPHEITVNLNGAQQGEYADKFIYGQDHADLRAWGWSSVGQGGLNVGMWMMTNMEFSDGGPMKHDVSVYPYSELNNSILTGELGMGSDGHFDAGEVWSKTCGPWFIYLNDVPATITGTSQAAQMLYTDALAQAAAEKLAWPYTWFKNSNYVPPSGRGTVTGRIVINDSGNPNASPSGLWVGLEEQPRTSNGTHDFQKWLKPYQFWAQTDAGGNFTIPNVLPGNNYTLWAYGPGAAGTFLSQNQSGGNPPLECDLPARPFSVAVTPGTATRLGTVTWTPKRVGATVFELGYPNRKANKFRHGEDFWAPGKSPALGYPTPEWGGQMEYPLDFPDGVNYTVGKSRWATDWNYILPSLPDSAGIYQPATGTINFDLANAPSAGAQASIYIACAGDDGGHVSISVDGSNLGSATGVTSAPDALGDTGFDPAYFDDSSIHFSDHGPFSDERVTFPGSMLHAGRNTIAIQMNAKSLTCYLMIDYLRLELTGYVPPAPPGVAAFAGNNRTMVCWVAVPGATSYNILRSAGDIPIATGITGPVCGTSPSVITFTDTNTVNGKEYHYSIQSVNPIGHSMYSPQSPGVTPSPDFSLSAPPAPAGLTVTDSGHHRVALSWNPSPGANYYSVWRTTLHKDGVGGLYGLRTIVLDDALAGTNYTDTSPTDGRLYSYYVVATNAAGTGTPSAAVTARPLPAPPVSAPDSLVGKWKKTRNGNAISLNWSPVPGAIGYVIYRSTGSGTSFKWPDNFLAALGETTYTDQGNTDKNARVKGLNNSLDYCYQVTAVNAAGISPSTTVHVAAAP